MQSPLLVVAVVMLGAASTPAPAAAPAEPPAFTAAVSGAGRPIILIPDLAAPGAIWETTAAHLAAKYQVHVLDIAGFAGNAPVTGPLLPKLQAQLVDYIRSRKLEKPILVGHMFGATVAFLVASAAPDLVAGIVSVDSPPSRGPAEADDLAEAQEGRTDLAQAPPDRFAKMMVGRFKSMVTDPERAKPYLDRVGRSSQSVVPEAFYDMMTRDLHPGLSRIHAPVLVFLTHGNLPPQARPMVEKAWGEQLTMFPKHELVVVPSSKHYVMFDQPTVFFDHLDAFLASAGK